MLNFQKIIKALQGKGEVIYYAQYLFISFWMPTNFLKIYAFIFVVQTLFEKSRWLSSGRNFALGVYATYFLSEILENSWF